ncbi:hypothetical protein HLB23_29050 [Nocardia uniformis]|uniref:Uncharacterized protein n=1 Tax=Nocardia uniformis TaxID=53432 RepID=A0A849CC14_9NOCA|nr:hypothetical protein [Nocardia uniformis]NNH73855.1 hypothetical protein [Nocardia uniformis]
MYELNRVRLYNIGPTKARYDDVLLDLSDGGPSIPAGALIPSPGQVFRRPALASLLVLENGGGKSVFIRMLLSTVLSERQSRKGREALRAYVVSAASPSHIALEWANVRTGETLLTGQVLVPTSDGKLERLFYSLNPTDGTGLSTLPFAVDRRRLSMNAFHDALKRLDAEDRGLRLEVEKRQGAWEGHLRRLGLEPDLFAVQQAMNVDEGDAAEAFKTTSGRQFVEWLLSKALDAENYVELGKAFNAYAKNIGRRDQLLLDRDFSSETAGAASRLAADHARHTSAISAAHTAALTLTDLAGAIHTSVRMSGDARHKLGEDRDSANSNVKAHKTIRDEAELVGKEVLRLTLLLRLEAARTLAGVTSGQLDDIRLDIAGWTLVPKVLKRATADEQYRVAVDLLGAAEQAAGTARRRRDNAGARYAGALTSAAQNCKNQAEDVEGKRDEAAEAAAAADGRATADEQQAARKSGTAELLVEQADSVDGRVEDARASGLLHDGELVAEAKDRLRDNAERLQSAAIRVSEMHKELERESRQLGKAAGELIEPEVNARRAAADAAGAARESATAAAILTSDETLRALAELDISEAVPGGDPELWLEENASTFHNLAAAAAAAAKDRLEELAVGNRADQRLIEALTMQDEALLPPRAEVGELIDLLADGGVNAMAGWRALEQVVNPRRHANAIQAWPALVDGIVVPDLSSLERARELLAEARPLPATAVLVATTAALEAEVSEPLDGFVVEPTPALHDPQAAAELREQARIRIDERRHPMDDLIERESAAAELRLRLGQWIHGHPAGTMERLRHTVASTAAAAHQAKAVLDGANELQARAVDAYDQHVATVAAAESAAQAAVRAAEFVERLATDAAKAAEARAAAASLLAEAAGHLETAREQRATAGRLHGQATEFAVRAESIRVRGDAHTERLRKVVYGTEPLGGGVDETDLAALDIAYSEAEAGFRAVIVGEDLEQLVRIAQQSLHDIDVELGSEPEEAVDRANFLAGTSEAGSPDSLEAVKRQLGRHAQQLSTDYDEQKEQIGALAAETRSVSRQNELPWTDLDAQWTPTNPEHGTELVAQAAAKLHDADELLEAATALERTAEQRLRNADDTAREMEAVHRGLRAATRKLQIPQEATPFAGTADEAQRTADAAVRDYGETVDELNAAEGAVRDATSEFRSTTGHPRFNRLKAPIYKQITEIDQVSLVQRAQQWASQLAERAASLTSDLEDSDRHRKLLIEQLQHQVNEALTLLDKAERLSRLPDEAGVWAGRRVLKIGFVKPEPQLLAARIAETVDDNARSQAAIGGRDLVLRCVGTAVPRDFKVEVLKPDSGDRAEYASISEMAKVFSGGQELTGAIMLYCTLAALRGSTRTTRGNRMGGMLILDNPIGKASADYLLNLQMNMAAALGVQLIYTTGSMEDRVLATFPLCIRLRNDADQRTGTRHLHVVDRVVNENDDDQVTGRVSTARLMVKPREQVRDSDDNPYIGQGDLDSQVVGEL